MKQKNMNFFKIVVHCILTCALLTGCISSSSPSIISNCDTIYTDVTGGRSPVQKLTFGQENSRSTKAYTSNGIYEISDILDTRNITFSDFITEKTYFLCNSPNCNHNNDSCTSYSSGQGILFCDESHLYAWVLEEAETKGDYLQVIYQMNLSGNEKRVFAKLINKLLSVEGHVCGDGENLYAIIEDVTQFKHYLSKITANGNVSYICELGSEAQIVSAYNDIIVFKANEVFDNTQLLVANKFNLFSYNVVTGEIKNIFESEAEKTKPIMWNEQQMFIPIFTKAYYYNKDILYILDSEEQSLISINLNNSEKINAISLSHIEEFDWEHFSITYINDDYAVLNYGILGNSTTVCIDLKNLSFSNNILSTYSPNREKYSSLNPIAFIDDKIIFYDDGVEYITKFIHPDGNIREEKSYNSTINYIYFKDYVKNIKNYHPMPLT